METKKALAEAGISGYTTFRVYGRGKQRGLRYTPKPDIGMRFLPKHLFSIVVEDGKAEAVIEAIVRANRTGNYGDGRIFVIEVKGACRISTGEDGTQAL